MHMRATKQHVSNFHMSAWVLLFVVSLGNYSCTPQPPNKKLNQVNQAPRKTSLETDLITYLDSAVQMLDREKDSQTSLRALTLRYSRFLPIHIYRENSSSPDSVISITISPKTDTTFERLDLSIPVQLQSKLRFSLFTDHFGPEEINNLTLDEFKHGRIVTINLNKFLHRNDDAINLDLTTENGVDHSKTQVHYITLTKATGRKR